ncbi:hypothetical protein Q4Q35_07410 [Flavivirga aquimarina]|uniref:Lipocalin-like domain-containing protein n=1 Tax=Flavivirga aquimarina TaxID=2027862 RepID=A0ABT8W944_9FLAO|nr:hypothetical protein [Flavivirga aquimarina]MDO5969630.1 hypothetical protein [Flavivirga aquimarina]
MKNTYLIFLSLLFFSCGVFKNNPENHVKINNANVNNLNGTYSIFAFDKLKTEYPYFDNANNKFYRKYGRGQSDTISFDTISGGKFKIKIIDDRKLQIDFIKKNNIVKSQTIRYKFKNDGFLYVKNRNTIIRGIPYVFGGVDVKKVRIALNQNNDLILNDIFDNSGALLLIFGDAKVWEETNIYLRINE